MFYFESKLIGTQDLIILSKYFMFCIEFRNNNMHCVHPFIHSIDYLCLTWFTALTAVFLAYALQHLTWKSSCYAGIMLLLTCYGQNYTCTSLSVKAVLEYFTTKWMSSQSVHFSALLQFMWWQLYREYQSVFKAKNKLHTLK